MPLRTYTDPNGAEWRVWRVAPDSVSFSTLGEAYRDGWLCFERVDGSDRRRLSMSRTPEDWDDLGEDRLDALCRIAEPAMRRTTPSSGLNSLNTGTAERDKGR